MWLHGAPLGLTSPVWLHEGPVDLIGDLMLAMLRMAGCHVHVTYQSWGWH